MLKFFKGRGIGYVLKHVAVSPLALLIWLAVEITNLFRPVFIVGLSYKGRITQYMVPMELHLRNANQVNRKYLMIFVMPAATPNEAVRTVYRRYSIIVDSHFPNFIRRTFSILAVLLKSRFTPELPNWQELWQLEPATTLTDNELKFGEELLEKLGIPKGAQYVCLGVKEAAYYASITPDRGYGQDLRHQASDSRNIEIKNYMIAATYLAEQGIFVVRVGSVVNSPLSNERHPMIIDYATTYRSELGDITLGANCKFMICGCTGSLFFAVNHNKPSVTADYYFETDPRSRNYRLDQLPNSILITRLYKRKEGNFLNFREMISANKSLLTDQALEDLELTPIPNSPEEILDLVSEMNLRLDNSFVASNENEELQDGFYNCFDPPIKWREYPLMRVANSFLRKYQDLL
jgi:putative glycosyltransferase (TIGR04372 family)